MSELRAEYRTSKLVLAVSILGLACPIVLTAWAFASGQTITSGTGFLLLVVWVIMLAASIPLLLLWKRSFVRIFDDHLEFRGLGAPVSVRFKDIRSLKREPDKLLIVGINQRSLGSISITTERFGDLEQRIAEHLELSGPAGDKP